MSREAAAPGPYRSSRVSGIPKTDIKRLPAPLDEDLFDLPEMLRPDDQVPVALVQLDPDNIRAAPYIDYRSDPTLIPVMGHSFLACGIDNDIGLFPNVERF